MSLGHWDPLSPVEAREIFEPFEDPWWIAGGWAIELFAGVPIRRHDDLDIEIPRQAAPGLAAVMEGWDLQLASSGELTAWTPDVPVPAGVNSVWCRPNTDSGWRVQVMFGQVRGGFWHYRRDERVRRALEESFGWTDAGFPILAPEIQLPYKASSPREKDEVDFKIAVQFLDAGQRAWLLNASRITCPESRWLRVLTGR